MKIRILVRFGLIVIGIGIVIRVWSKLSNQINISTKKGSFQKSKRHLTQNFEPQNDIDIANDEFKITYVESISNIGKRHTATAELMRISLNNLFNKEVHETENVDTLNKINNDLENLLELEN